MNTYWGIEVGDSHGCSGSVLDCVEPRCRSRAAEAVVAARLYSLDYLEKRVGEAAAAVRSAVKTREMWELYLEAKQRAPSTGETNK